MWDVWPISISPLYNICTQWLSKKGNNLISWSQSTDLPQTRTVGLLYPKQTQMPTDITHLVLPESQDLVLQSFENFTKSLKKLTCFPPLLPWQNNLRESHWGAFLSLMLQSQNLKLNLFTFPDQPYLGITATGSAPQQSAAVLQIPWHFSHSKKCLSILHSPEFPPTFSLC